MSSNGRFAVRESETTEVYEFCIQGNTGAKNVGEVIDAFIRPEVYPGPFYLLDKEGERVDESMPWNEVRWPVDRHITLTRPPYVPGPMYDAADRVFNFAENAVHDKFCDIDGFQGISFGWPPELLRDPEEKSRNRPGFVVDVDDAKADSFMSECASRGIVFPFPFRGTHGSIVVRMQRQVPRVLYGF